MVDRQLADSTPLWRSAVIQMRCGTRLDRHALCGRGACRAGGGREAPPPAPTRPLSGFGRPAAELHNVPVASDQPSHLPQIAHRLALRA
jgi:hypothetical protein